LFVHSTPFSSYPIIISSHLIMSAAASSAAGASFTEKLDEESLKAFSVACKKRFSEQAQFFLNAFWDEFGDQAEVIYSVLWDTIKRVDMHHKGVMYIHLYEEGDDLDFDMCLYLFEKLVKFFDEDKKGPQFKGEYPKAVPQMQTSIVRKKELRDRVDVNFDGRISFLEFLLYQFNASPKTLMERQVKSDIPPEVLAAMKALEEVNKQVRAYETEKQRLEDDAASNSGQGIKALKAKNELAQLNSSPLWEKLNKALITAEAAVRIASRKYGVGGTNASSGSGRTFGTIWWMERELRAKQEKYGKK